jgi:putative DNA primase/helicase
MAEQIDFRGLAEALLARARELVPEWLPGGKTQGAEYVCSDLRGGSGESFSVNLNTGKWKDFATAGVKGGDLISLYAAINNLNQRDAAIALQYVVGSDPKPRSKHTTASDELGVPPVGVKEPNFDHRTHGKATSVWAYRDADGSLLFYIARFDNPVTGKKEFAPFSWSKTSKQWVKRSWPSPRPLYGIEKLKKNPCDNVLIVEGEKTADAVQRIVGPTYNVVTWMSGSSAWDKADWTPLYNKNILIWPDADNPGIQAALGIAQHLVDHCPFVKAIDVRDRPDKWDGADALAEGWTWEKFKEWAKPRARIFKVQPPVEKMPAYTPEVMPPAPPDSGPEPIRVELNVYEGRGEVTVDLATKWRELGLTMSGGKNPAPIMNSDNIARIFQGAEEFKAKLWFDEFHKKVFTTWRTGAAHPWGDDDHLALLLHLQRSYGLSTITENAIKAAVGAVARETIRNEPKDYMRSLKWDGTKRVEDFLKTYMNCSKEPDEYLRAISGNFWISMVARVMVPGCKVDNAIVLEGRQGKNKSTALNVIAGKWFVETNEDPKNKDFFMILQGALIVELAELDSFSKADLLTVKKTMSCRIDRYRAPYGSYVEDHPRSCVFVGTTNQDDYLKDPTGARRFWPTMTGELDLEAIKKDRDQLFAEAVWRYDQGFPHWVVPEELAKQVQEDRYDADAWEERIKDWMRDKKAVLIIDVAESCIGVEAAYVDKRVQNRIGNILRRLGYKNKPVRFDQGLKKMWINEDVDGLIFKSAAQQSMLPNFGNNLLTSVTKKLEEF